MKNLLITLCFFGCTFAKAQYSIDRINAPVNPLPLEYTRAQYGLKGNVEKAFVKRGIYDYNSSTFNAQGYLISQNSYSYFYDTNGNLIKRTAEGSNPITYTITTDPKKRITRITDGDKYDQKYSYNAIGLFSEIDYGNNSKKTYTYDSKGRLISDNSKYQEYIYTYQSVNNILQVDRKTVYKSDSKPTFTTRYFNDKGYEIYGLTGEFLNTYDKTGNCLNGVYFGITNYTRYSYFGIAKTNTPKEFVAPTTADAFDAKCISGDCKNGWGKTTYTDGSFYEGFWENGFRNGYGTFTSKNFLYAGEWRNHNINGVGYGKTPTQNLFGHFQNSLLNGNGYRISKDKTEIGHFQNSICEFPMTVYNSNNTDTGCLKGKCNSDFGKYLFTNGDTFEGFFTGTYMSIGDLKNPGKYVYQGEFNSNKYNGFGRYQGADGTQYAGYWKDGKYNGLGYYAEANGKNVKKGEWKDGVLVKAM